MKALEIFKTCLKKTKVVATVFTAFALYKSIKTVPAGHVGIVDLFGKVKEETLEPGIHLVNPLSSVKKVSMKTRSYPQSMTISSQEGMVIQLDTSVLYHLEKSKV